MKANLTKIQMVEALSDKGIEVNSKSNKDEVESIFKSNRKKLSMGNRTGMFYFGTRAGTWAGKLCRAIALGEVHNTKEVREKVTAKHSFSETFTRLVVEGIITRDGKSFELTSKGRELAAMYKARIEN